MAPRFRVLAGKGDSFTQGEGFVYNILILIDIAQNILDMDAKIN